MLVEGRAAARVAVPPSHAGCLAQIRGPNGSSLRGHPAASELLEAAGHLDMLVVRTALEEVESDDGGVRVNVPIRELAHREELFRTAVFRVREGAITSFETLGMD